MSNLDDTQQAENISVETEGVMPTHEQPTESQPQLPEDASERTRQEFEKLKAKNKELADKLAQKEQVAQIQPEYNSVLDELNPRLDGPSNLMPGQVEDITKSLTDKDGYIDADLLNKTLQEANERAKQAEEKAKRAEERMERFEETQEVQRTHSAFPQLDPYNPNFDRRFYELTKNEVIGQMMQGKKDYMAAAKRVAEYLQADDKKAAQQVAQVQEKQKVISQREMANATTGTAKAPIHDDEYESLVSGTRTGDSLSIGQRLKANGF
jgi:hypothetical protein